MGAGDPLGSGGGVDVGAGGEAQLAPAGAGRLDARVRALRGVFRAVRVSRGTGTAAANGVLDAVSLARLDNLENLGVGSDYH